MGLVDRLQHAWNAFKSQETFVPAPNGVSSFYDPTLPRFRPGTEKTIVNSIYNRIAIDAAAISIKHVRLDENGRYSSEIKSSLNNCLTVSANIDQTGRALIQDAVMTLCDEGVIAIVPTVTDLDPINTGSFSIEELRVGRVIQWFPDSVQVNLYNDQTGDREDIYLPKKTVAIVENPLYSVMNDSNSTVRRLIRKLSILDAIDEQSGSGKLDLIIQLPYIVKTPARKAEAERRRTEVERQLTDSKYGIAYIDGAEKIVQLNRSLENNLMSQIEYLTRTAYGQLGITEEVMNGTADEKTMLNYYNRTIEPILSAIVDSMIRTFLTKTARTQGQSIKFFRDPFRLVPVEQLAEIADKFTRNEILSSNEIRSIIGYKPVDDPRADELRNKNLNQESGEDAPDPVTTREGDAVHSSLEHHGVKGQQWGVRNGPPYPIEQGKNRRNVSGAPLKYKSPTAAKLKQLAIRTAKQTIAMLDPTGLAAMAMNAKAIADMRKYDLDSSDYAKKQGEFESLSKLKKQTESHTIEENCKEVNPSKGKSGGVNNCLYCVTALELRERGYDVEARRKSSGSSTQLYSEYFKGAKPQSSSLERQKGESRKDYVMRSYENLCSNIEKYPDGSRGFLAFTYEGTKSGHTISWSVQNGSATFYDGQSGSSDVNKVLSFSDQSYIYGRLDNCPLNESVTQAVISKK